VTVLVGTDIQAIDEVEESLKTFGDRYVRRIYTNQEIEDSSNHAGGLARALASRFAAKEAVFKILGDGELPATWKDVEVRRLESGFPMIVLHGVAADLAAKRGFTSIFLSLSQGSEVATAVVVAELDGEQ
jgi:holo-[acyl-carrier protein] synthase